MGKKSDPKQQDSMKQLELTFEGEAVEWSHSKVRQFDAHGLEPLKMHQKVRVMVDCEVVSVDHKLDKDLGLIRVHALKALEGGRLVEEL